MQKLFQINPPGKDAGTEEQMTYIQNLVSMGSGNLISGKMISPAAQIGFVNSSSSYFIQSFELLSNLGLGYWLIDQEAGAGRPPSNISIIKGQFDPNKTKQALVVSAKNDPPATEIYLGSTIYSWGGKDYEPNLSKRLEPPAYDMLGRGGRFVFQDNYAFRTNGTPEIKLVIDTQKGKQNSLADVIEYKLLARELSSHSAMTALLTNQTVSKDYAKRLLTGSTDVKVGDIDTYLAQGPKLLPYQTMALGVAKDEKGFYALVILVHADSETASKNVDLFKRRMEETTSAITGKNWTLWFPSSSITSHGRVLTAKLYGDNVGRTYTDWYYRGDPLLLHE
jgi:hypothetical protein